MKTVVLLDLQNTTKDISFLHPSQNPGIGGSEAYLASLAMQLHSRGLCVFVGVLGSSVVSTYNRVPTFRIESVGLDEETTVVLNSGSISQIRALREFGCKFIVVSHHPHDASLWIHRRLISEARATVVSLGEYQAASNGMLGLAHKRIPGFWPQRTQPVYARDRSRNTKIGFVGSLHPSKGLHDALSIVAKMPPESYSVFQVIGSSSLYSGGSEGPSEIPISDPKYRLKIEKLLDRHSLRERVVFEGLVDDIRPYLSEWRFAILNPRGFGEADSQTLKELLSNGVPTFASRYFGLGDYSRAVPLAAIGRISPVGDARAILHTLEDDERFTALIDSIKCYVRERAQLNERILDTWVDLLVEGRSRSGNSHFKVSPHLYSFRSRVKIFFVGILLRALFLWEKFHLDRRRIS